MKRMSDNAIDLAGRFTYGDYRKWPDEERWELIDGAAYEMCAAPTISHQGSSVYFASLLFDFLRGKPCRVFPAPIDVLLPRPGQEDDEVDNCVEPDIVVVCDPRKIDERFIRGAPDLLVEILSPSTSKKDINEKFNLYERSGVREYWVIEPKAAWLNRFTLEAGGKYGPAYVRSRGDGLGAAPSTVLEGLFVDIESLFTDA
ncbi:MAG: Uma2 family endonuclease [Rectinemataceae bacterium]